MLLLLAAAAAEAPLLASAPACATFADCSRPASPPLPVPRPPLLPPPQQLLLPLLLLLLAGMPTASASTPQQRSC
jgi:hypothetical protein